MRVRPAAGQGAVMVIRRFSGCLTRRYFAPGSPQRVQAPPARRRTRAHELPQGREDHHTGHAGRRSLPHHRARAGDTGKTLWLCRLVLTRPPTPRSWQQETLWSTSASPAVLHAFAPCEPGAFCQCLAVSSSEFAVHAFPVSVAGERRSERSEDQAAEPGRLLRRAVPA